MVSRKVRRAAVSWFRWKVPKWAGALTARQHMHTPSWAGDTSQGPLHIVSHMDIHNGMLALASFTDMLNMSEHSDGLSIVTSGLLCKDLCASPKCYQLLLACPLPFTPTEERGGGRPALLLAYRDIPRYKLQLKGRLGQILLILLGLVNS